jgi:hypothetical protein
MKQALRVIDFDFNDVADVAGWSPDDPEDFDEWITVTVGDESGGSNYQVHLCTPASIRGIDDKRGCFLVSEWEGVDDLVVRLDEFILERTANSLDDPDHVLAKYWLWEYASWMGARPRTPR